MEYVFIIPNRKRRFRWLDPLMLVAGLLFFLFNYFIPGILLIIMAILGMIMRRNLKVVFNEESAVFYTFPKKKFIWEEFENVLYKDGILTVDFKNNRIVQEQVIVKTPDFIVSEFNTFCGSKIS